MKYRLFSLRKQYRSFIFLSPVLPLLIHNSCKSILGPLLSFYPHIHANKPSQITIKKYVCAHSARLLYVHAC